MAIVNPARAETEELFAVEGLAAPLILRFPYPHPIYPLALTGTGNFATEVLIYVDSTTKMSCNGRMTLRYADRMPENPFEWLFVKVQPNDFFKTQNMDFPYLCKFKDRLRPNEMTEDLVFSPAEDYAPYRESIIMW